MDFDAIVVGAGFGGLYALKRLRDDLGLNAHLFEQGSGVGGTWYWNKYPGAMSDTRSHLYCYSFDRDLLQDQVITQHYRMQPEILNYLEHVAERYDLNRDISLNSEVTAANWDEDAGLWKLTLADGRTVRSRFIVTALGLLSKPNIPPIKGIENFTAEVVHTARWPETASWKGKRVGIIGTGSTGVQVITAIAPEVESLTVFQRSPQYSVPSGNDYVDADFIKGIKDSYDEIWANEKNSLTVFGAKESNISAHSVSAEERERIFEEAWAEGGGFRFMFGTFNDIIADEEANKYAQDFIRRKIASIVTDPVKAQKLMPKDLYAKRPLCDAGYYQRFNQDNVDVVDIKDNPIDHLDGNEVVLADGDRHELDMLIFATGFDAVDGNYMRLNLTGRGGLTIQDHWKDGAHTFLGIINVDFPNMFMVLGPNSPFSNLPPAIEIQVDMITDLIKETLDRGARQIEPTPEAERGWLEVCRELTEATILPRAKSWIFGANIPGKPYTLTFYMGGYVGYKHVLADIRQSNYAQFAFRSQ